jgi:hypothetical protein
VNDIFQPATQTYSTDFRGLHQGIKVALLIVILSLGGVSPMTIHAATTKTTAPVRRVAPAPAARGGVVQRGPVNRFGQRAVIGRGPVGRGVVSRGPVGRGGPAYRVDRNGRRLARVSRRVWRNGAWVVVYDWEPVPDNVPVDFFGALGQGLAFGIVDGLGMDPTVVGLDPLDDPVYADVYVQFAREHHLHRGPNGRYIMPANLRSQFLRSPRFVAARNVARTQAAARSSRGGGPVRKK